MNYRLRISIKYGVISYPLGRPIKGRNFRITVAIGLMCENYGKQFFIFIYQNQG